MQTGSYGSVTRYLHSAHAVSGSRVQDWYMMVHYAAATKDRAIGTTNLLLNKEWVGKRLIKP